MSKPAGKIEFRKVADIQRDPRNARTHSDEQIAQIMESIRAFGFVGTIAVDEVVRAGNGRHLAVERLYELGETVYAAPGKDQGGAPLPAGTIPVLDCTGWTEAQRTAFAIADNQLALNAEWNDAELMAQLTELQAADFTISLTGFGEDELAELLKTTGGSEEQQPPEPKESGGLARRFIIPPFSVFNAREGWWQDRKRAWVALGIKSELGRGDDVLFKNEAVAEKGLNFYRNKKANPGGSLMPATDYSKTGERGDSKGRSSKNFGKCLETGIGAAYGREEMTGTSIFDPVLCEIAYRWFSPSGGTILDPFAGGSVRGIVAGALGRSYVGVDLRAEQIDANRLQWDEIAPRLQSGETEIETVAPVAPVWHTGDSAAKVPLLDVEADMIMSCPPYGDLEVYSDDPADISNMPADEFDRIYADIIAAACGKLKMDRFAFWVVGEYRGGTGGYQNIVGKTVAAFEAAGLTYYGEAVLLTAIGSLPIRAARAFEVSRKLGKTHQNILIFCKGDPKKAALACGTVDVSDALAAVEVEELEETEDSRYGEQLTSIPND